MILGCNDCKTHKYQDQKYGEKKRVMNECPGSSEKKYRCTVCGKERSGKETAKPVVKDDNGKNGKK